MDLGHGLGDREKSTEEKDEEFDTSSSLSESTSNKRMTTGTSSDIEKMANAVLKNNPNDERHVVEEAGNIRTPPDKHLVPTLSLGASDIMQQEKPLDINESERALRERFHGRDVHILHNHPSDERVTVEDEHNILTPKGGTIKKSEPTGLLLRNAPYDEAIPLSSHGSIVGTPSKVAGGFRGAVTSTGNEESTDEDNEGLGLHSRAYGNQRPEAIDAEARVPVSVIPNLEYNPQDYVKVNATASREMQELFKHILDYQPVIPELPAKLRPFIPDYVPSIGDLDPFCKISRPDGRPDGLGIYVLDEPSVMQSNPAVVLLELRATNIHSAGGLAEVVDSFEDAANRPEVIDRWIADVKKVHCKKPLPTTNYQKPMPEIDSLLQVWPSEFEEFLNSDIQFPPPHIDLDMDQYVRTLCCVLDIPTYNSLIDSLHVMFTLYQEFRSNQHFQHE